MAKIHKKQVVDQDVYSLALDRLRLCYERFDKVVVSFSGGKDSTTCMNLAIEVAREQNKLPVEVLTFDEEAIPPETVEYMERVRLRKEIKFAWYCLPVESRNACSRKSPNWYPWAEEDRAVWCRELPEGAITDIAGFNRETIPHAMPLLFAPKFGEVCIVMGIRTQESMARYGSVARKTGSEAFLSRSTEAKWQTKAYPVYDWATEDVWLAAQIKNWDFNRAYDKMEACGLGRLEARCSPPYGEQPIRRLWSYRSCWPELWAKMTARVPGAATAARYANTDLYGIGMKAEPLVTGSWRDKVMAAIQQLDPVSRQSVAKTVKGFIGQHYKRTSDQLPDDVQHPQSGYSWRLFHSVVAAGGNKYGRQQIKTDMKAKQFRNAQGFY